MGLEDLTAQSFEPHVGEIFTPAGAPEGFVLRLEAVEQGPAPGSGRAPFSLFFRGPAEVLMTQGTQSLSHETFGSLDIFMVPVSQDATGVLYEAVFS